MSRIVYVNGEYLPEEQGRVSIFDRGFLFADGVYEVSAVLRGRLVDNEAHLARLHRSLKELNIPQPVSDQDIVAAQNRLIERNGLEEGLVYLQITRGPADRDFAFPARPEPTLIMFTQAHSLIETPQAEHGIRIHTVEDIRWKRRDIKTVGLLAPSMAKQAALDAGADDAWMVEDGYVTEGTSNNAFIVTADNVIRTRQLSNLILHGITRAAILRLAEAESISVEEGLVYLQITRGPADRDFAFPARPEPTLIMFTQAHSLIETPQAEQGIRIHTVEDIRWKRRDIKTVGLLAPSMAKQAALDAGADDAWMVEDGYVTEGTSNNAFIVTADDQNPPVEQPHPPRHHPGGDTAARGGRVHLGGGGAFHAGGGIRGKRGLHHQRDGVRPAGGKHRRPRHRRRPARPGDPPTAAALHRRWATGARSLSRLLCFECRSGAVGRARARLEINVGLAPDLQAHS